LTGASKSGGARTLQILNSEPTGYSREARSVLESIGEVVDDDCDRARLIESVGGFDVLIVRLRNRVDGVVLDAARRLKVVVSATTGLDHIDLGACKRRGIEVLSLRGETEFLRTVSATAEHTWALLLGLIRHLPAAHASVLRGEWDRDEYRGHELDGKRLGIVGLGRLGSHVARYGQAFGMSVSAHDPHLAAALWPVGIDRFTSLTDLMARSDVVSLHVPLTDQTRHMIGARELALLPRGSVLVNTSRGQVLDEHALLDALAEGRLAGAALDVIDGERDDGHAALSTIVQYARTHPNLLVTPHIGGATHESMAKTEIFMARKLERHLRRPEAAAR